MGQPVMHELGSGAAAMRAPKRRLSKPRRARKRLPPRGLLARALIHHSAVETVLPLCGYRSVGVLASLNREWRSYAGDDSMWHAACRSIATESGLYVPRLFRPGWRRLFWELLWPSRHKWRSTGAEGGDFKVRVFSRFRPSSGREDPEEAAAALAAAPLLPLHQRMQLLRAGRIDRAQLLQNADGDLQALMETHSVPASVLEAIDEAQRVKLAAYEATAAGRRRKGKWKDLQAVVGGAGDGEEKGESEEEGKMDADGGRLGAGAGAGAGEDAARVSERTDPWQARGSMATATAAASASAAGGSEDDADAEAATGLATSASDRRSRDVRVLGTRGSQTFAYVPGTGLRAFRFAHCFPAATAQQELYENAAREAVVAALNGFNACVLCYGQTGSGKTYTMFGSEEAVEEAAQLAEARVGASESSLGVVVRACSEVLDAVARSGGDADAEARIDGGLAGKTTAVATVQYVQIYQDRVFDLMTGARVAVQDTGAQNGAGQYRLVGAREVRLRTLADVARVLQQGERHKRYAATAMNERSSRAHTVFAVTVRQTNLSRGATLTSTLHLVDLAGSERVKRSRVVGQSFAEAVRINYSLLVLGRCIEALVECKSRIPYKDSVLTMLLKSALGGNSRTNVVVTCSSDVVDGEETLNSLRFGERCSMVTNVLHGTVMTVHDALRSVDEALAACKRALQRHEQRERTHLPIYHTLAERYRQLMAKRACLLEGDGNGDEDGGDVDGGATL